MIIQIENSFIYFFRLENKCLKPPIKILLQTISGLKSRSQIKMKLIKLHKKDKIKLPNLKSNKNKNLQELVSKTTHRNSQSYSEYQQRLF